ncbi:MAG: N-acetylmuramidase family protein [Rhizorhabdus sp.]|uniref:N-acetylmuramidase family protein n=1 Tax=Rhizorhabdus sp. TaxID=1968843 RepID=UPI001B726F50|nr:N-acetylmuramidase family protein [Rhizorhabdus sp.]MBP8236013.1 N-acetylmuramidase family protein [Rhizorhabdus sp.]
MFDDATVRAVATIAARLKVESAALLAVAEVESGGKAFARVAGRNEPLIRFEGHYFDRRLTPEQRKQARAAGLASPKAGGVPNPAKQEDRWKLLNRAILINSNAAMESVSWGVGQVMGAHWKALGYGSVTEMVNACRASVAGQVEVMARFIEKNGLAGALRGKDWPKFARAYNGPAYKQNAYDTKMARAYAKWAKAGVPAASPKPAPAPVEPPKPAAPIPVPPDPSVTPTPPAGRAKGIWALIIAALLGAWLWLTDVWNHAWAWLF